MACRDNSNTKKKQNAREFYKDPKAQAIKAYNAELAKLNGKGAHTVAKDFVNLYKLKTGMNIKLSYCILIWGADGGRSWAEANAAQSWLTDDKTEVIIKYIGEVGNWGFPLSHCRLKEHVDQILRARLGKTFLANSVGKQWTNRFIKKNSSKIKMSWSTPLESKHGCAVSIHIPKMPGSCCCSRPSQIMVLRQSAFMALMKLDVNWQRARRNMSWGVLNLAHSISNMMGTGRTLPLSWLYVLMVLCHHQQWYS